MKVPNYKKSITVGLIHKFAYPLHEEGEQKLKNYCLFALLKLIRSIFLKKEKSLWLLLGLKLCLETLL
jgi:hypothetical protein